MFSDGGHHHTCTLSVGFFGQYPSHECAVVVVQMADWFIQEDEVERLAQGTDESYALLLPEGEFSRLFVDFVRNAEGVEERERISFFFFQLVSRFFSSTFSNAVSSVKMRNSWNSMLNEYFRSSTHSPMESERMLRSSKQMMP